MAEAHASPFEVSERPAGRSLAVPSVDCKILEQARLPQGVEHLLGVVLPVGGEAQDAASTELPCDELDERRLNQAPLVMALLRPGIGKEHQNLIAACIAKLLGEHVDGIPAEHAHVAEPRCCRLQKELANPRTVYLDTQEVHVRRPGGEGEKILAVAEADFDDSWCMPPEDRVEIERSGRIDDVA